MNIRKVLPKMTAAVVSTVAAALLLTSCGGSKSASAEAQDQHMARQGGREVPTYELACSKEARDNDDFFGAVGMASGSVNRMDVLQTTAITNAQEVIRQRIHHAFKGTVTPYSEAIGESGGTDMALHVERAGEQIIDRMIPNTDIVCGPRYTDPDDGGRVTCYVGVRISKKDVVDKIADAIENSVSDDEAASIRLRSGRYRERMLQTIREHRSE